MGKKLVTLALLYVVDTLMPVKNAPLPTKKLPVIVPTAEINPRLIRLPPVTLVVVLTLPTTLTAELVTVTTSEVPSTVSKTLPSMSENAILLEPLAI